MEAQVLLFLVMGDLFPRMAAMVKIAIGVHEEIDHLVGDKTAPLLVFLEDVPDDFDGLLFHFGGHHPPRFILSGDPLEFLVIIEEVEEVVVGDIDSEVGPFFDMLLLGHPAAREGFLADLFGEGLLGIVHEDHLFCPCRARFVVGLFEAGEKAGLNGGGLEVVEFMSDLAGHPEVGVLVDRHRDEAEDLGVAEDVGKGGAEGGGSLEAGPAQLSDIVAEV